MLATATRPIPTEMYRASLQRNVYYIHNHCSQNTNILIHCSDKDGIMKRIQNHSFDEKRVLYWDIGLQIIMRFPKVSLWNSKVVESSIYTMII